VCGADVRGCAAPEQLRVATRSPLPRPDDASLTISYNRSRGVARRGLAIATLDKPRVGVRSPARGYAFCKRTLDVTIASITLVILSPLVVLVALGVRLTSPGSALFRHERVGLDGRVFRAWKFRTMRADRPLPPDLAAQFEVNYKLTDDPRITGVGRWLRRTSIDEIPQLVNVLRREMSLVGPRSASAHVDIRSIAV
jgi:lipopolysaccharide/colanic/teichoic acid biosynthesis glycosyltransferase